ncbi:MAG: hypothetical protein ACF8LL_09580, partial [Phycisphaerales bacterium]
MDKVTDLDTAAQPEPADPTPHLSDAHRLVDEAIDALDRAIPLVPAYSVESIRFLRSELAVARRRRSEERR